MKIYQQRPQVTKVLVIRDTRTHTLVHIHICMHIGAYSMHLAGCLTISCIASICGGSNSLSVLSFFSSFLPLFPLYACLPSPLPFALCTQLISVFLLVSLDFCCFPSLVFDFSDNTKITFFVTCVCLYFPLFLAIYKCISYFFSLSLLLPFVCSRSVYRSLCCCSRVHSTVKKRKKYK